VQKRNLWLIIVGNGESVVNSQPLSASEANNTFTTSQASHDENVSTDGLDHLFKWASDVVADGEDVRIKLARERRIRRQVLDVVNKYQQQRLAAKSKDEIAYLQRRVIALMQKLQEMTEENAAVKQIMVGQYYALQRIPQLEYELNQLKKVEYEREAAVTERRYLMDALSKIKVERDFLEDTLLSAETENGRLSQILNETRSELSEFKARRWWHPVLRFFNVEIPKSELTTSRSQTSSVTQ
jgi:hypothetical protein